MTNKKIENKPINILDIGHRIKVARVDARLTTKELADKLEVSPSAISLWESNKRGISAQNIWKISTKLGRPISYFFWEDKLNENKELWKQEYPETAEEAFITSKINKYEK